MTHSAQDVNAFTRQIEVRLAEPQPRIRYEKGKPVKEPVPDIQKVIAAIQEEVTRNLQVAFGTETEILITSGKAQDVRLTGTFQQKASEIRSLVGEVLADAFENLEVPEE